MKRGRIGLLAAAALGLALPGCGDPVAPPPAAVDGGPPPKTPTEIEAESLADLTAAFRSFRIDTDSWPFEAGRWTQPFNIDPTEFTSNDTALFALPPGMTACERPRLVQICWDGPYLDAPTPASLGSPAMFDAWGHPLMFAMIRPDDAFGEGTPAAPRGAVLLWSRGPDGTDQTGCYDNPGCLRDIDKLVGAGGAGDDMVVFVGVAK